jgi:hypothetical protein
MKLLELQQRFSLMAAQLIGHAVSLGFGVTLGEAWRPPETARMYAKSGKGIAGSLHCERLAIDLNLFAGDAYLTDYASYKQLGEWWESVGTKEFPTCWGGRFKSRDANHFSVGYNGRK